MYVSVHAFGMTYQIVVSDSKVVDLESAKAAFAELDATVRTTETREPEALIADATGANALIVNASTQVRLTSSPRSTSCRW